MLFRHEVRDCCVLRETLIKTKAKLMVFGAPGAFRGSKGTKKASQTLMIHKVSAKSLKKQMRKENELKRAYNSLSKSSFAKNLCFMKNTIQNAYNSLSKSSFLRFTVFSKITFKKSSNSLSKLVLF